MAVQTKLVLKSDIKDTSSHALVKSSDASRSFQGTADVDTTLTSTSTPDLEGVAAFTLTFTAGAVTLDLTSITHADGDTRTAAGKSLRFLQISNPSANTGNVVATKGASNGHSPVGSTFTIPVSPGGCVLWYFQSDGAAITNSSNDTIDFSGTGTESFYVKLGWG